MSRQLRRIELLMVALGCLHLLLLPRLHLLLKMSMVALGGLLLVQLAVLLLPLLLKSPFCPSCQQLQCLPIARQWFGLVTRRVWVHRSVLTVLTSRFFFRHVVVRREGMSVTVVLTGSAFLIGTSSARFPSLLHDDRAR